jgi:HEPN domain-containing protein
MNTSIRHFSSGKQELLHAILKIVRRTANPEKIILFGLYGLSEEEAGDTAQRRLSAAFNSCELLVVVRRGDRRAAHDLQDAIENRCRRHLPVTVLVHDIDYVNSRLSEGHYFFATLYREAILLYDAGAIPLMEPASPDLEKVRRIAQQDFERWKKQARAFFESALFNTGKKEWKVAVFLLHQAAEHMYQAILLAFNGYKPTTHNLDKLRRYTNRFSIELALLFPCDNEEEERLFRLLLQGYVEARYNEKYTISEEEAGQLTERVGRLLSIGERICGNRFISLGKMASGI